MAAPGSGIKFLGLDSALVDLAEKKSTLSNNKQEYFTASDIANGITAFDNGIVINETGADSDTRIEGQSDANLFFVDASTDRVGVGTNTPTVKFDIQDTTTVYSRVYSNSTSTAGMQVQNSSGGYNLNTNSGAFFIAELGGSQVFRIDSGSNANSLRITSSTFTINENAQNLDTRIEGQTDANLFFVDASTDRVGIGTNTPNYKLDVVDSVATYIRASSGTGTNSGVLFGENGSNKFGILNDRSNSGLRVYNYTSTTNAFFIKDSNAHIGVNTITPSYQLDVNGDVNVASGSAYYHNGTAGLSGTYTFGGGSTGDIATMTFNGGILTAVTTVP